MIDRGARSQRRASDAAAAILGLLLGFAGGLVAPIGVAGSASSTSAVAALPGSQAPLAASLSEWTGGVNLYRSGVFTTQASWLYCTAADIQIIRNMIEGTSDHSSSAQTGYFDWMRTQNQYDLPLSAGIDPTGWTAGMRHFVDDRYQLVSSQSFNGTVRSAVERLRLTNLPIALTVSHGNHGWVLNGFTATADPAVTSEFEITSVSVTGPLWGLQSKNGYDMPPNTTLTVDELATYFTRWHYDPLPMVWDGSFVSIQPVPAAEAPAATPIATPAPTPTVPAVTPSPTPVAASATLPPDVAVGGPAATSSQNPAADAPGDPTGTGSWLLPAALVLVASLALVIWGRWARARSRAGRERARDERA
jgi:hypothetical protein